MRGRRRQRWLGMEIITDFIEQNSTKSAIRNPLSYKKLLWKIGGNFEPFWPLLRPTQISKNKAVIHANLIWLKISDFLCFYDESRLWMASEKEAGSEPIQYSWPIGFLVVWILLIIKAISLAWNWKMQLCVKSSCWCRMCKKKFLVLCQHQQSLNKRQQQQQRIKKVALPAAPVLYFNSFRS